MPIDFSPLYSQAIPAYEFAALYDVARLRSVTAEYFQAIHDIIQNFDDAALIFEPIDPKAKDLDAKTTAEITMGWSLAHLVLHVTASLEEGAAISSLLARGVSVEGRFRYEPDWRTVTTRAQVMQRLDESQRMANAYLGAWPDQPLLDVYRKFPEGSRFADAKLNAPASYLFGLGHMAGHLDQFREVASQAAALAKS